MLTAHYYNNDLTARPHPVMRQTVRFMRWATLGWCDTAEISADGDYRDIGALLNLLRSPVEIWDEHGTIVWNGIAYSISYTRGSMQITYSLDTMFNTIKVAYSWVEPGTNVVGIRKTTAAATDADSVGFYGTKELLKSTDGMTDAAAETWRNNLLAQMKYPVRIASGDGAALPAGGASNNPANITISCKGWIHTLGWRLATVSKTGPETSVQTAYQNLGDAAGNTKILQQFTVGSADIYVTGLTIRLSKVGTPSDNVTAEIYALDGSGNPTGTALLTGFSLAGGIISTGSLTLRDSFTTPLTISKSTQYGIVIARSGAVDGSNYYKLTVDGAAGYSGGVSKTFDGTNWSAATANDLYFRINIDALDPVTQQIRDLIYTYGVMLDYNNVTITDASTITRYANLGGDTYALTEIAKLQQLGYSDAARMVIKVTPGRQVEIYKASTTPLYKADSYNRIYNAQTNEPIRPYIPPIGSWIEMTDLMPETVDTSRLITPGLQYLVAYEWRDGVTTPIYEMQEELQGALSV